MINSKTPEVLYSLKTKEVIKDIIFFSDEYGPLEEAYYVRYIGKCIMDNNGSNRRSYNDRYLYKYDWLAFETKERFDIYKKINDKS